MMNLEITRELVILAYKAEDKATQLSTRSGERKQQLGKVGAYFHAASIVGGMDILELIVKFPKNEMREEGRL